MRLMKIKMKHIKKMSRAARHMSRRTWTGIGIVLTSLFLLWGIRRWRGSNYEETISAP